MSLIRPLLPLLILGGLGLFAWQNWSPSLPLVFLGRRTQELPLAFWLILAIVAGALTLVVLSALQAAPVLGDRASDTFRERSPSSGPGPQNRSSSEPRSSTGKTERSTASGTASAGPVGDWEPSSRDWVEDSGEDWDGEAARSAGAASGRVYEREQRPEREVRSGSEYSYTYERGAGVGRTESVYSQPQPAEAEEDDEDAFDFDDDFAAPEESSPRRPRNTVYDADYRVITPPLSDSGPPVTGWSRESVWQPPEPSKRSPQVEEDDWGLTDEDEDWDDRP